MSGAAIRRSGREVARPRARRLCAPGVRHADDDLHAFGERIAQHLGAGAVGESEPHVHRLGLVALVENPYAAGGGAAAPARLGEQPFPCRALLGRQDLGDARVGLGADALGLPAALGFGGHVADAAELLPRLGEDVFEPCLLRLAGLELLDQARAKLLHCLAAGLLRRRRVRRGLGVRAAGRTPAQGGVGHLERHVAVVDDDAHVGGHAGQQRHVRVLRRDHHGVADHVLHRLRRLADLADLAVEAAPRESVDREGRGQADAQAAHIGLVDRGFDLHVAQVLRDGEEHRRLQARGDRLPGVDVAQDDRPVHRGADDGALQVHLRLLEQRLALLDRGLRAAHLRLAHLDLRLHGLQLLARGVEHRARLVELRRGDELLVHQHLLALEIALGIEERDAHAPELGVLRREARARHRYGALRGIQVGARLAHAQLVGRRVDARDHLAALHRRVEVGVDVLHLPGDLRADLHRGDRVQRPARHHDGRHRAALHLGDAVFDRAVLGVRLVPVPAACGSCGDQDQQGKGQLHDKPGLSFTPRRRGRFAALGRIVRWARR
jgi:hypothetical protein